MIALIKTTGTTDIISDPIPDWIDITAFSVFNCYGYALCEDYHPQGDNALRFTFSTREITNPYKQSEDDPDTITQRIATINELEEELSSMTDIQE